MAGKPQQSSLPLPSPAQIALALVTVRSKPGHITIEEHLRNIRQCILTGAAQPGRSPPKQIDASRFWKDAFLRSQGDNQTLQAELSALRQQLEKTGGQTKPAAKRKAEIGVMNKANTYSKRKRTERETPDEDAGYSNADSEPASHPAIQRVLRALLGLLKPTSSSNATQPSMSTNIQLLCRALRDCLQSASVLHHHDQHVSISLSLAEVCPPVVSSLTLILSALTHSPPISASHFDLPRVTSSIVALFQTLLDSLHQLALTETKKRDTEHSSKQRKTKPNTKATKKSPEQGAASFAVSAALLVRTMQHLVAAFDLDNVCHCHIFKSMLSGLLDHIGSVLSLLVFADPLDAEEGDRLVEQPGRWRQNFDVDKDTSIAATEMEAPYVLAVLKFTLRCLRGSEHTLPIRSREILGGSLTDIDNELLSQKIEKRLQDTLMRGVFGADDEKFKEAFTRPPTPDNNDVADVLEAAGEEGSRSEWFIGQVWELLGWDMLSGNMARKVRV